MIDAYLGTSGTYQITFVAVIPRDVLINDDTLGESVEKFLETFRSDPKVSKLRAILHHFSGEGSSLPQFLLEIFGLRLKFPIDDCLTNSIYLTSPRHPIKSMTVSYLGRSTNIELFWHFFLFKTQSVYKGNYR